ncbi:MAG: hypothetical protein NVS3B15_17990 [Sediminibacterium sp.]
MLVAGGGMFTGLINALQAEDLVRTCVLAGAGTIVSFVVTVILKKLFQRKR